MALSADIISLIRDEIGDDTDFVDNDADIVAGTIDSLESIYTDTSRGNYSVLNVAAIVWRRRLANYQNHAFDAAQEGNWLARSQKARFLRYMVERYERLANQKAPHRNTRIQSEAEAQGLDTTLASG
jgi:hypothetical protein